MIVSVSGRRRQEGHQAARNVRRGIYRNLPGFERGGGIEVKLAVDAEPVAVEMMVISDASVSVVLLQKCDLG